MLRLSSQKSCRLSRWKLLPCVSKVNSSLDSHAALLRGVLNLCITADNKLLDIVCMLVCLVQIIIPYMRLKAESIVQVELDNLIRSWIV